MDRRQKKGIDIEYDTIARGWRIGFGEFLIEDLREACLKTDFLDKLKFLEIKEKYGTLRMYHAGAPQEVEDVLDKYEFISEYVCIQCGSPYACMVDDHGWYLPLCECCWDKNNKNSEAKESPIRSWDEIADKKRIGIPDEYKRKIRFNGEDRVITYDISETANKIRRAYEKRKRIVSE